MKKVIDLPLRRAAARIAGGVALLIPLLLIAACATGGKVVPEPAAHNTEEAQKPTVSRLEDGRTGFVLREVAKLDAAARRDFERGAEALENEDYEKALELFDRVIGLSPEVSAPHVNIAMAYGRIDRPEPAEEHLKKALELVAGHPLASHEYGLLLRRAGRFAEARGIYEQSLSEFPEYYPLRRNLGILCDLYLNDGQCALEQYEAYQESRPEEEEVKVWISELRLRLGQ